MHLDGRTFLIEELPLIDLVQELNLLPTPANSFTSINTKTRIASNQLRMPSSHEIIHDTKPIQIASVDLIKQPGVVLDYNEINYDQTDYTFASGVTYYVTGWLNMYGTTTFEKGAVLKFNGGTLNIDESGTIVCPASGEAPVCFTSVNDDSVGEVIPGSSGVPSYFDTGLFLNINASVATIRNLRFYYGNVAIQTSYDLDIWHCQFVSLDFAVQADNVGLHNVLIANMDDNVIYLSGNLIAENITVTNRQALVTTDNNSAICLTNCLISNDYGYLVAGSGIRQFRVNAWRRICRALFSSPSLMPVIIWRRAALTGMLAPRLSIPLCWLNSRQ
jgi:hypothetical protein